MNDTLLRPKDWINDYKLNMMVRCSLRVRLNNDSVPGPTFDSQPFEAGVKPESTVYEVTEGGEISVTFTSSVPIGCIGSTDFIKPHCSETLKIAQPEYQNNPSGKCVNNIRKGSMVFETQDCGVTFSTTNWMLPVTLTVKGYIDNIYNSDNRKSYIRLITYNESATDPSGAWDTVDIPEIQVIVSDKDSELTGRYCGTWNDPRYRTADGKYFIYQGCGEHVLYRNKRYPYWPESTVYEVTEGGEISVTFTSSVPIGCIGSTDFIKPHCSETLKIAQPEYQNNPSGKCVNNIRKGSMVFETQDCGVTFSTTNWMLPVTLTVKGYIDNIYNSDNRKSYIRLITYNESATDPSGAWDTVDIPEIQVIVSDKDSELTGRYCGTWNDPRYRTADGKYFIYQGCGEHVLYRNKRYPYWVHTLTTRCWWRGSCNCGIAIRSHDSLFVVRTCNTISTTFHTSGRLYPFVSYAMCDNKHMTIQKLNRGYKVTLPIGTEISFTISGGWIPVITIKPSTLDIEQTEGLCGFVSKTQDTSDDFIPRGSSFATSSVIDFARSWSVGPNSAYWDEEDLFSSYPSFPRDLQLNEYCLCAAEADHKDDITTLTDIHCNLSQPLVQCESAKSNLANKLYQECHKNRMRRDTSNLENDRRKIVKRSALDSDDLTDEIRLSYHANYDPNYLPPVPEWQNGWNENSARDECTRGISEMAALELCQKYANIDIALYIELCIEDIKIAGSADYISYMIWLMEDACKFEILRNESLFTISTRNDGLSVLEMILDHMCPNNCSYNGVCNKTECICSNNYIGSDCSVTLADAPKEISVPDDGLCGTKSRDCKKTNIFGQFYTSKIYCKLEHFIVTENGKQLSGAEVIQSAVYSYENLISCNYSNSRKKRSINNMPEGYDITLSFDQNNYGDTVSIIIYDEDCFSCNSTSIICIKLDSCTSITTYSESAKSSISPGLYGAIGGALLLITVAGLAKYKCGKRKQNAGRKIIVKSIESTLSGYNKGCRGTAPSATNLPQQYNRRTSDLSISWSESSRPNTPANLFLASVNN